jgi:hypothetical protein
MAKRKKKHQKERVLEPLAKPGKPIREAPHREPVRLPREGNAYSHLVSVLGLLAHLVSTDDARVRLEEAHQLLGCRHALAAKHPALRLA